MYVSNFDIGFYCIVGFLCGLAVSAVIIVGVF